jgi:hypothetical protein
MAYKISQFSELCVLYVRSTKEVIKEGSYFYCQAIRDSVPNGKSELNIVTSEFFNKVLGRLAKLKS